MMRNDGSFVRPTRLSRIANMGQILAERLPLVNKINARNELTCLKYYYTVLTDNHEEAAMSQEKLCSLNTLCQSFHDYSLANNDPQEHQRYQRMSDLARDIVGRIPAGKRAVSGPEWYRAKAMIYHAFEIGGSRPPER